MDILFTINWSVQHQYNSILNLINDFIFMCSLHIYYTTFHFLKSYYYCFLLILVCAHVCVCGYGMWRGDGGRGVWMCDCELSGCVFILLMHIF